MARDLEISSPSAILHILEHRPSRIQSITLIESNSRADEVKRLAQKNRIPLQSGRISDGWVSARLHPFQFTEWNGWIREIESRQRVLVLLLDHLQDPQNFGALCRTAEGLGVAGIVIAKDRSVQVSPGVYSSSVGAVETIPILSVANIGEAARKLKHCGLWLLGAALDKDSKPIGTLPTFEKVALILGTEELGIGNLLKRECDALVSIPMNGKVQSLNVSASGAILMYALGHPDRP